MYRKHIYAYLYMHTYICINMHKYVIKASTGHNIVLHTQTYAAPNELIL